MATHKVKIGETVFVANQNAGGPFVVIKRMPERHDQFEYRARTATNRTKGSCAKIRRRVSHSLEIDL